MSRVFLVHGTLCQLLHTNVEIVLRKWRFWEYDSHFISLEIFFQREEMSAHMNASIDLWHIRFHCLLSRGDFAERFRGLALSKMDVCLIFPLKLRQSTYYDCLAVELKYSTESIGQFHHHKWGGWSLSSNFLVSSRYRLFNEVICLTKEDLNICKVDQCSGLSFKEGYSIANGTAKKSVA